MYNIAEEHDFDIMEIEVDKDHIHLLIEYNPTQSILQIVRHLKQISTYRIWRMDNNAKLLKMHFWKERTFGVMVILPVVMGKSVRTLSRNISSHKGR